jgi:hypothetical protein
MKVAAVLFSSSRIRRRVMYFCINREVKQSLTDPPLPQSGPIREGLYTTMELIR